MERNFLLSLVPIAFAGTTAAATPPARMTIPYRVVGSTVLLPVSINGTEPGWFIADSGANSCVIDRAFARRIGLHPITGGQASGAGKGTVPYDRYEEHVRFSVAGLPLECPEHVIGLDFSQQPKIIGAQVDGVLGTDFFASYVVEIDYAHHVVRAYNPEGFRYTGTGARIPLYIDSHRLPHIDAKLTVNGNLTATRRLLVDSGSQDAADDSWVTRSRNLQVARGGVGTGQAFDMQMGRFSEVRIGPFRMTDVPGGAAGQPLVGGEILKHFAVIFDWSRKQLILEPNAGFARSLADSGAAGFGLRANPDGTATIDFVSPGTPAARADFAQGDLVVAIDGTPSGKFTFPQLSEQFRRARSYRIGVVRDNRPLTLQLDL
jgi:hypothetical protein